MNGWKKIRRSKFLPSVVRSYNGTTKARYVDGLGYRLLLVVIRKIRGHLSCRARELALIFPLFSVDNESLESLDVCSVVFSRIFSVVCTDQKHLAFQQLWQSFKRGGWVVHVWNDAAKAFLGYTRIRSYIPQKGRVRSQELKFSSSLESQKSSIRKVWD